MKTHYDPYPCEFVVTPACGTPETENTEVSIFWQDVDCSRCIARKTEIEKSVDITEKEIVRQMGEMAEFNKKNPITEEL